MALDLSKGPIYYPERQNAELAEEYKIIQEQMETLKERKEAIAAYFKRQTGERVYGEYRVLVTASSQQRVDGDKVKALLGARTPMKEIPIVTLTVDRLAGGQ